MTKKITISVNDWILNTIIGKVPNVSARSEELMLKGFMAEQGINVDTIKNGLLRILSADLSIF